jgi:hypothetical protein
VCDEKLGDETAPIDDYDDEREISEMGLTGMVFSIFSMAVGAVMYWAVTAQGHGFRYSTVGVILMIIGAVGLVASTIVFGMSRRSPGGRNHTYDRQVIDAQGRSAAVHEEVH